MGANLTPHLPITKPSRARAPIRLCCAGRRQMWVQDSQHNPIGSRHILVMHHVGCKMFRHSPLNPFDPDTSHGGIANNIKYIKQPGSTPCALTPMLKQGVLTAEVPCLWLEREPKKEKKRKKKKKKKKQKLMLNENIEESWKIGFSSPRKTSNDTGAQSPQSNLFPYAARKKRVWLHSWWPVPEPSSRPKQGPYHTRSTWNSILTAIGTEQERNLACDFPLEQAPKQSSAHSRPLMRPTQATLLLYWYNLIISYTCTMLYHYILSANGIGAYNYDQANSCLLFVRKFSATTAKPITQKKASEQGDRPVGSTLLKAKAKGCLEDVQLKLVCFSPWQRLCRYRAPPAFGQSMTSWRFLVHHLQRPHQHLSFYLSIFLVSF